MEYAPREEHQEQADKQGGVGRRTDENERMEPPTGAGQALPKVVRETSEPQAEILGKEGPVGERPARSRDESLDPIWPAAPVTRTASASFKPRPGGAGAQERGTGWSVSTGRKGVHGPTSLRYCFAITLAT